MLVALSATASAAAPVDLYFVLGNAGYEDDLVHSQWTVTKPNATYTSTVPVNPMIEPLDPAFNDGTLLPALVAPVGDNFIGVENPTLNDDIKGKLAHDSVAGAFSSADEYVVVVWGNRGRLDSNGNTTSTFPGSAPVINVQFLTWGAGSVPTVDANDNWSRSPTSTSTLFTNWGDPGEWTSQTFTFTRVANFSYLALAISGQNNNHDQYVAWDIGAVPEPSSVILAFIGAAAICGAAVRRRLRKRA
jgi:hypothetical protein